MLIIDKLSVSVTDLRPSSVTKKHWANITALASEIKVLGTFPIPGFGQGDGCGDVEFRNGMIEFKSAGEYYIYCSIGVYKILNLRDEDSILDKTLKIFKFISRNTVHSVSDSWLHKGEAVSFLWTRLTEKLFHSDQPLQLVCAEVSAYLAVLLRSRGIESRLVALRGEIASHAVLEVWDPDSRRWIMLDADFGVVVADRSGRLLSVEEIAAHIDPSVAPGPSEIAQLPFQIIDLAEKCWPEEKFVLPESFVGHVTWRPEHQSDIDAADPVYYLKAWRQCWGKIEYQALQFDDAKCDLSVAVWSGRFGQSPPAVAGPDRDDQVIGDLGASVVTPAGQARPIEA